MNCYNQLLSQFDNLTLKEKLNAPFPMAVFGTLRQGWSNNFLMGAKCGTDPEDYRTKHYQHKHHYKAFLSHFIAEGITLYSVLGASTPFEVFDYNEVDWNHMIKNVDRLEGYSPNNHHKSSYYHRTLMWLRILPSDFQHFLFDIEKPYRHCKKRNLELSPHLWHTYPPLPCWVYSSISENKKSREHFNSPIIWDGCNELELSIT